MRLLFNEIVKAYFTIGMCVASFYLFMALCTGIYRLLMVKPRRFVFLDMFLDFLWIGLLISLWPIREAIGGSVHTKRWIKPWRRAVKAVSKEISQDDDD